MSLAITRYLDAGYPVLYVRTTEHNRALEEILANLKSAGLLDSLTVMVWKSTIGLYNVTSACPKEDFVAEDLKSSLEYIAGTRGAPAPNRLYIIFNPKDFLKNPIMLQQLKDTAYAIRSAASHIIMVGCSMDIPEEIEDVVTTIDMELPDKDTIKGIFRAVTTEYASELGGPVTERDLDVAADNALGLSAFKAENAISLSIVESKGIDIGLIRKEKQLAVKQSGVLEYIHHTETVDSLGGFDVLKDHVSKRKRYFSNHKEAVEFGLRPPKGIMLVGVAGTGKSLAAKAVSAALELPLYKFDVGSVFKGVVGQSIAGDEEIFLTASTASGLPIYRRTKIADAQALFESGAQVATLGADESGRLSTTETTDFFKHRSAYKKLLKIRTQRGREVVVTPEHSLFTNGAAAGQLEVVAADKVRKGTRLAIPSNAPDTTHQYTSFRKTDLLHLYELDAQKYQSLPDDICLTEEFAELCGWWLAEGSTTESSYRMCVHNDSLQRVTSLVEGMGESPRIYDTQHSEMCRDVHVGSRISRMLELFGFGGVGVAKRVPEIVFSWEHRFIAALLRGYISGDGSFHQHCLEVTTISDGMLRDVRFLLTLFGIVPGTGNKKQATMRSIMGRKPSRCKEAFRLTVTSRTSLRILLDRIGPFLDNITCPLEEYLGEDTTADRGECYPLTLDLIAELKKAQRLIWKITGECRVTMGVDVVSRSKLDRIFHLTGMTEAEFAHSFPAIHRIRTWNICFDRVQSIEEVDSPAFVYDISVPASELFYVHGGLLVHNSEASLRNALKLAETVSPCVMLLDEMEKLLAGVESSGKTDSGVTSRVIGTLISWMQETKAPIYKLATCNTIRNLDAALFRRGRWDAVFAVDLPNEEERKQIISIHIQKRGRSVDSFDLTKLAGVTESFVGAEIESVVDEAMYIAFDAERDMTTDDLVTVANGVVPISRTDQEAIQSFRQWMETRATPVSKVVVQATAPNIRNLRIA